ncbi:MAG: arginine--tRNA ligase [Calditrichaceae bacterium]|nr:arginine--tRNA ligase [Calditrichia bacterium]NUQ44292.1 arginine--tRNA ligase [Calditrichaceae bacterium]
MLQFEAYLDQQLKTALKALNYPDIEYQFDRPKAEAHGDISVNLAMLLAKSLKQNPRQIAQQIVNALSLDSRQIAKVEIAGPGFINFFLAEAGLQARVPEILQGGENYGRFTLGESRPAMVEFVSANPTGPLTVGHGRGAVVGDTVANLLEWSGYKVTREYYFNDAGRQMRVLGDSVRLRYLELLGEKIDFPEDYYQGEYIKDIAAKVLQAHGSVLKESAETDIFKETAVREIFADINRTLESMNVRFDSYFNEMDLYRNGDIDRVIENLKKKNLAYEQDGALWFKASQFGLEKDRVIVKSSGEPTYRLPDIAYHIVKFQRQFEIMVDIFGADHIATYPDVLAGLRASGYDSSKVKVLIHQFVTLMEGTEKVKMSTRKANFVTLDELIAEAGGDVTRWFFLMRSMQSHLNFDLKLAKTHSEENPVYYNQYAHARICSILRNAEEKGIRCEGKTGLSASQFAPLREKSEFELIKKLLEFPKTVYKCALDYEPHLLPLYLSEVSTAFHKFYTECRVISEDEALTRARLGLCLAVKTVLGNGFRIVGVSAPERM